MPFGEASEAFEAKYEYRFYHTNGVELLISVDTFASGVPEALRDEAFQDLVDHLQEWDKANIPASVGGGKSTRKFYQVTPTPLVEP